MTILDDAEEYYRLSNIENDAKKAKKPHGEKVKRHLQEGGSDYTVRRVDPNSGEVSEALELRDRNTRYFLRSRAGAWKQYETTCPGCGHRVTGEVRTQSPSVALDSEPIADLREAAREAQRRPVEVEP